MPYTPNNPYIPGDPYSYDLKWLVTQVKANRAALDGLDERIRNIVIRELDQHDPVYYSTAQELIDSPQKASSIAYIEGYYAAGDGGANLYYITDDYNDIIGADFYLTMAAPNLWALPVILTPYVTPEMFGAAGDGITDDSAAIQITVKMPYRIIMDKMYKISTPVDLESDTIITGSGTILSEIPSGAVDVFPGVLQAENANNITIHGITVNGPGAITSVIRKCGFFFKNCTNVKILRCEFYDIDAGTAIKFNACTDIEVDSCRIERYTFSGISMVQGCKNGRVTHNYISGIAGTMSNSYPITLSALESNGDPDLVSDNMYCDGNTIIESVPKWEGIDAHGGTNITIVNNIIKGTLTGIALVKTTSNKHPSGCIVSNNIIELGTAASGFAGNNSIIVSEAYDTVISNNVGKNANYVNQGSGAFYLTGCKRTVFSNNIAYDTKDTAFELREVEDLTIDNCSIIGITPANNTSAIISVDNSANFVNLIINNITASKWDNSQYSPIMVRGRAAYNNGSYIRMNNVIFSDVDDWINSQANSIIVSPTQAGISGVTMGKRGDMIIHRRVNAGDDMIFICTQGWADDHTGGAWQALGTYI